MMFNDTIQVILNPQNFYKNILHTITAKEIILFGMYSTFTPILFIIALLYSLLKRLSVSGKEIGFIIISIFLFVILLIIIIGFLLALWKILGSEKSYLVSIKCVGHTLFVLPILSISWCLCFVILPSTDIKVSYWVGVFFLIWEACLLKIASKETHKLSTAKSWLVGILSFLFIYIIAWGLNYLVK